MARSAKQIAAQLKASRVSAAARRDLASLKSKKVKQDAEYKAMGRSASEAKYRKRFKVSADATIEHGIGPFRGPFKPKRGK